MIQEKFDVMASCQFREAKLGGSSGSVESHSGPAAIFCAGKKFDAEHFEPDSVFPGRSVVYKVETSYCPSGLDSSSQLLRAQYDGPALKKQGTNY